MRFWSFVEMDTNTLGEMFTRWVTMSDQEILDYYWDYWSSKMLAEGPNDSCTFENCIDDFCIIHWAERNYWREMKEYYE